MNEDSWNKTEDMEEPRKQAEFDLPAGAQTKASGREDSEAEEEPVWGGEKPDEEPFNNDAATPPMNASETECLEGQSAFEKEEFGDRAEEKGERCVENFGSDFVENRVVQPEGQETSERTEFDTKAEQFVPPEQPFSPPAGVGSLPSDPMVYTGVERGQQPFFTGYQHFPQSYQQTNAQPFTQQPPPPHAPPSYNGYGRPPYAPLPYGNGTPPPYQPYTQQAYQWPEHRASVDTGMQKRKMSTGTKLFLWIACGLAACFVLGFGLYGVFVAGSAPMTPTGPGYGSSQPGWSLPFDDPEDEEGQSPYVPGNSGETNPSWGGTKLENQPAGDDPMGGNDVYEKAKKSVVGIRLYEPDADLADSYIAEGSGVIMTQDGYIITNSHVLEDSGSYGVQVVLYSGEEYTAKVVGFDKKTDLAVIKIEASGLTAAELGNSDDLRVGDRVYALGNPGGLNYFNSLTGGWVSALDRAVESTAQTAMRYIQTDAAINPGNSGGALLNRFGQVVGINTAKIQGYEGMGFSIPMSTAKGIIDDLMRYGYVAGRVRIGITGQQISSYVAEKNNVPQGVVIVSITNDSPLKSQGIKENDIITHVNGVEVTSFDVLTDELAKCKPGDTARLTIFREGNSFSEGSSFTVTITLLEDRGETQKTP